MVYKKGLDANSNKKIGILTINDYNNYGNRLQNYAVQEVLKSLGFQVETLVNTQRKATTTKNGVIEKFNRMKKMNFSEIGKTIYYRMNRRDIESSTKERIEKFQKFTKNYIYENKVLISEDINTKYDYFVVGSDQVWNPNFRHGSPIDFLRFASRNKRIAYAPSFGVNSIPDEFVEDYRLWLAEFNGLSVREEAGAKIIKDLTGRDAKVLVDPTLMLSKEEWLGLSRQGLNKPSHKYLLTYFLGDITNETKKRIKQIASLNNLEIVRMADIKDKKGYSADPSEFIDYINSAAIFLTDSFHGCVFSILLEKPFVVFDRVDKTPSMNSRIDTLLSTFNLKMRKSENLMLNNDIFNIDYSHVASILESERNKAFEYLKQALDPSQI